ncbi:hypothetical protein QIS99_09095 [Streptomyces sp. B-S-A8]|uniref:Uncharacterized protein n=1 Tax=Streptomyces solicavernae TaxID=3043614 RepID=A0ABT6RPJ6_9ACTN|nr:hypothetical protein [Streptomyces sp. B-S-A8]MDI3386369.1 hypothetical protein [Streptomyces sp. B-S-A8]
MPLIPEEPQIHESAQGPRATSANGRPAPTPRAVPGPRPAAPPRPGRPGPPRPTPPAQRTPAKPGPAATPATPVSPGPAAKPAPAAPAAPAAPTAPAAAPAAARAGAGESTGTPQIQLIPASAEGALDAAEEAVDLLLDTGRAPGEILVITTGDPHPWAAHELSFGADAYWAQHDARDDVFYAAAADIERAGNRPVVVVAVNGASDDEAATALPLALSRAGALLIVCGDPQRINSALGAGV